MTKVESAFDCEGASVRALTRKAIKWSAVSAALVVAGMIAPPVFQSPQKAAENVRYAWEHASWNGDHVLQDELFAEAGQ